MMHNRRYSDVQQFQQPGPTFANTKECVDMYNKRIAWLRDSRFLKDLERDSVDSDLLEEELEVLQEEEVPQSVGENVVKFLRSNPVQILLCVLVILDAGIVIAQILLDLNYVRARLHKEQESLAKLTVYVQSSRSADLHGYTGSNVDVILALLERQDRHHANASLEKTVHVDKTGRQHNIRHAAHQSPQQPDPVQPVHLRHRGRRRRFQRHKQHPPPVSLRYVAAPVDAQPEGANMTWPLRQGHSDCTNMTAEACVEMRKIVRRYATEGEDHHMLRDVAHGLHFASISILGFLVIEDLVKIVAMGREFFKHKIEIFDAIIILASFAFDIVFLNGVSGEEGEKAAAILIVLLLWRIMRVIDGIVVTTKQRQEFRIRLQKRAKKKAERRIDLLEEDKHRRIRQISSLKDLCSRAGITDTDIEACTPRQPRRVSTTMCALSSVARLSVSMTMSMSSGLFSMMGGGDQDNQSTGAGGGAKGREEPALRPPRMSRESHRGSHCSTLTTSTSSDDTGICLDFHSRSSGGGDLSRASSRRDSLEIIPPRRGSMHNEPGRRASLTANMSDIEEESSSQKSSKSSYCSDHTSTQHLEPVNTSGVQIVIDSASEHNSCRDDAVSEVELVAKQSDLESEVFEQGDVDSPTDYKPRFFLAEDSLDLDAVEPALSGQAGGLDCSNSVCLHTAVDTTEATPFRQLNTPLLPSGDDVTVSTPEQAEPPLGGKACDVRELVSCASSPTSPLELASYSAANDGIEGPNWLETPHSPSNNEGIPRLPPPQLAGVKDIQKETLRLLLDSEQGTEL